ncbi:hypothetical protein GCM10010123_28400 [Pilimelia anulata]|uniref:Uncharacterized protein n=1 Tax=Pilimelia anulata TaxID=53371 RepID=A0A8J3FDM0_9ACTN|nr:hypothetical protein [Pilimelia anulata]GGJ96712.1 hypothetical protein GCM10010123_28400 [Pilimelia anulata]
MTLFVCGRCGARLTANVAEMPLPTAQTEAGPLVPAGRYATAPPPPGDPAQRGIVVLNPADVVHLEPHPESARSAGCCGPAGGDGWNRRCRCGADVAVLAADCWQAAEVRLNPGLTRRARGPAPRGPVLR